MERLYRLFGTTTLSVSIVIRVLWTTKRNHLLVSCRRQHPATTALIMPYAILSWLSFGSISSRFYAQIDDLQRCGRSRAKRNITLRSQIRCSERESRLIILLRG